MFILIKEESLLKVVGAATLQNRDTYQLLGSDNLKEMKEELKCERSPTLSMVQPTSVWKSGLITGKRLQKTRPVWSFYFKNVKTAKRPVNMKWCFVGP